MRKKALLLLGILVFVVFVGYLGSGLVADGPERTGVSDDTPDTREQVEMADETPDIREQIETSDGPCYTDTSIDPKHTYCLLEKKPPNILVKNLHDEEHNVTVRIYRNSTVTYSANSSLGVQQGGYSQNLGSVIRKPGSYTIRGTLDGKRTDSHNVSIEDIYLGDGGTKWVVIIGRDGGFEVRHRIDF